MVAAQGQDSGRIVGKVVEAQTGQPLSGVRITIAGTSLATSTRVDGQYVLGVPAGSVTLRVAMIGFTPKAITDIKVIPGTVVTQDIALAAQATVLEEVVTNAEAEQGSVNAALATQQQAAPIVNSISSEQMKRSPGPAGPVIWSPCRIRFRVSFPTGDRTFTKRLFGSIVMRDRQAKFLTYANDF